MWLLIIILALPLIAQADEYLYEPDPSVAHAFRQQWADINETLARSAAIRAEHARQRQALERARRDAMPLPPEWEVDPRYMPPPIALPPPMPSPPMPSMLRTPSGDLYYQYGNMIQGPHGELYTIY